MSRRTTALIATIALAATAALVPEVAAGGAARDAAGHTVVLKAIRFHPGTLSIRRGDSVTWLWRDGRVMHNVTFGSVHSRTMSSGSFTVHFLRRGTFEYRCTIHVRQGMRGKIVVN